MPQGRAATRSPLWSVLAVLLALRLALIIPAQIGANAGTLQDGAQAVASIHADPRVFPATWARWDSGFYLTIAAAGYSRGGKEVGFFPGYPILMWALALGQIALLPWAGTIISNVACVAAALLLWQLVERAHGPGAAWAAAISLAVFPTAQFMSALYAESLIIFLGILAYWFSVRRQYWLAAVCVALASVTRITGFLLIVIPLTKRWQEQPHPRLRSARDWIGFAATAGIACAGLAALGLYDWLTQGSPLAYVTAQETFFLRSVTWPWQTVIDATRVVLTGYGGNESNRFMRLISAQDLAVTLLFIGTTVLVALWLRRSLLVYYITTLVFLLASHGPYALGLYSMSRYLLVLWPAFIAFGILLTRWPRFKWAVWALAYGLQLFLTALFANGRWVA